MFMFTCVTLLVTFGLAMCLALYARSILQSILCGCLFITVATTQGMILYITHFFESHSALGRLEVERKELLEKYRALDVALQNVEFVRKLNPETQELLKDQADTMKVYLSILNQRIRLLEVQESKKKRK